MSNDEIIETLLGLAEKADNYIFAATLPVAADLHVQGLLGGMRSIKAEIENVIANLEQ
jgi:hypothetical protein